MGDSPSTYGYAWFKNWVRKNPKRRSLLWIPFLCASLYLLISKWSDLPFKETLTHWLFIGGCGGILLLCGAIYSFRVFRKDRGFPDRVVGFSIVAAGILLLVWGGRKIAPQHLPSDKLVVAVARFTPVTPGAAEEAGNFTHRLYKTLTGKGAEGKPLEVRLLRSQVSVEDEEAERQAAIALCKSPNANAHIIIWGDVQYVQGRYLVTPKLAVVRRLSKTLLPETKFGDYQYLDGQAFEFEQRVSDDVADVVVVTYALAFFADGKWEAALQAIADQDSLAAHLLKGMCMQHIAESGKKPLRNMNAAVTEFDAALRSALLPTGRKSDEQARVAAKYRAAALLELGQLSEPKDSVAILRKSVEAYRALLSEPGIDSSPTKPALMGGLGDALITLAVRVGDEECTKLLEDASEAFRSSLKLTTSDEDRAQYLRSLSIVLARQSERVLPREGLLRESVSMGRMAVEAAKRAGRSDLLADSLDKLGCALRLLGSQIPGDEGYKLITQAVLSHEEEVAICKKSAIPCEESLAKENLGAALLELGTREKRPEDARRLLEQSVKLLREALPVLAVSCNQYAWATAQVALSETLHELSKHVDLGQRTNLLLEAVELYTPVTNSFSVSDAPELRANVMWHLGNTLSDLADLLSQPAEKRKCFQEALACYGEAVNFYDPANRPIEREILMRQAVRIMPKVVDVPH
jgi:tetratricopeptide (TPR) repeat protein